jgi:hypothetical protein
MMAQEEAAEDSAEAADLEEVSTADQEKCIKQFALNVSKNVKFHSSQQKVNQFIAKNVLQKENLDSRVSFN